MRARSMIRLGVVAAAAITLWITGHRTVATVVGCGALALALLAVAAPAVLETLGRLEERAGRIVGNALGMASLTLIYYSVFLLGAGVLRLRRADPLNRRFPNGGRSNWIERVGYGTEKPLYAKQYTHPHGRT